MKYKIVDAYHINLDPYLFKNGFKDEIIDFRMKALESYPDISVEKLSNNTIVLYNMDSLINSNVLDALVDKQQCNSFKSLIRHLKIIEKFDYQAQTINLIVYFDAINALTETKKQLIVDVLNIFIHRIWGHEYFLKYTQFNKYDVIINGAIGNTHIATPNDIKHNRIQSKI